MFCFVTNCSWAVIRQNEVWHEKVYQKEVLHWTFPHKIIAPISTFIKDCWAFIYIYCWWKCIVYVKEIVICSWILVLFIGVTVLPAAVVVSTGINRKHYFQNVLPVCVKRERHTIQAMEVVCLHLSAPKALRSFSKSFSEG